MPIDSLAGVILAALGVCVLAVILALLVPHIFSSAPVLEVLRWLDSLPSSLPCEGLADPKG